eukprot:CAMPEP_0194519048 /NCGR_PEP_ID=MMETSP0253-20130528/52604_1 /TAXON_ID=2966 /ORGANISM="Noctiluca scintillans" /LENGTH=73 /DNA_ID=CAMNT_0039363137 /DNA_START=215 /DNA_END=436 /DNA_ORIENTATION=-
MPPVGGVRGDREPHQETDVFKDKERDGECEENCEVGVGLVKLVGGVRLRKPSKHVAFTINGNCDCAHQLANAR